MSCGSLLKLATEAGVSRHYLRMAALYRRAARPGVADFSWSALLDMQRYETYGGSRPGATNGYLAGKRFLDVTLADAKTDAAKGYTCKAEYLSGPSAWLFERALSRVPAGVLFPYAKDRNSRSEA